MYNLIWAMNSGNKIGYFCIYHVGLTDKKILGGFREVAHTSFYMWDPVLKSPKWGSVAMLDASVPSFW